MFKYIQRRRDYKKCLLVIDSCVNICQVNAACNLVYNFYVIYGICSEWRKLDIQSSDLWRRMYDTIDYEERLNQIE